MGAENSTKSSKKKKVPGRPFQPGQSGNPGGRPKLSDAEKQIRRLSREQYSEVWNLILGRTKEELEQLLAQGGMPLYMEKSITFAINMSFGEWDRMHDRIIGKVPDQLDLNDKRPFVIKRRDGTVETVLGMGEKPEDDEK